MTKSSRGATCGSYFELQLPSQLWVFLLMLSQLPFFQARLPLHVSCLFCIPLSSHLALSQRIVLWQIQNLGRTYRLGLLDTTGCLSDLLQLISSRQPVALLHMLYSCVGTC